MTEFNSEQEYLDNYNVHDFDVPLASVDLAIFTLHDGELKVLLVERSEYPAKGRWALPGGFIDQALDGDLEACALRKLKEKTGVSSPYVEQVATVGNATRDPRGWSMTVLHMALIAHVEVRGLGGSVEQAKWVSVEKAMKMPLAFDHCALLASARERLQNKTGYTYLPACVLPKPFTLSELQQAYEAILGRPLDKKTLRRRLLNGGRLHELAAVHSDGPGRPAAYFEPAEGIEQYVFERVF